MPFQCVFSSFRPMKNWNSNGNRISLFNDFLGFVSCCRDSWALIPQKRLYFRRSKRNQNDNFQILSVYMKNDPAHQKNERKSFLCSPKKASLEGCHSQTKGISFRNNQKRKFISFLFFHQTSNNVKQKGKIYKLLQQYFSRYI